MNVRERVDLTKEYRSLFEKSKDFVGRAKFQAVKTANGILARLGIKPSETEPQTEPVQTAVSNRAADLYAFDDTKTKAQRQSDNNAVFDLLDKIESGEITEPLSESQKAVLAKYSGSGGGLKSRDGKTGSAHEYYTPAPIANAMWRAVEEMGFGGGKVLDPCGGSGIFGAFAPENAIVQAVEMDKTSAEVNRLVNGSERYHVDNASFEERAESIPDNSVDAIVTNVPFGGVELRKHRNKDGKFRKENLQTYFVLRSLDKLKHGGLAAFIVPASFLDGKGGKAANARVLTSQIAEFIGAYRLPNSVFGTAAADVATDILFFRKYSREVTDKIAELQAQNPELLTQSNVMWQPYLDGKYFKLGENKKFIFGEEGEIESWRTDSDGNKRKVYAVLNDDSVANIAKAIKRFHGSRIDWEMLEAAETEPQMYETGDVVYQNGQAYRYNGATFDAVEPSENESSSLADSVIGNMDTPLAAFENNIKAADALAAAAYYNQTGNQALIPSWLKPLAQGLTVVAKDKQEKQFRRVVVGLSVQYVMEHFGGNDQTAEHPDLSDAMKERVALDKALSRFKTANEAIKLHYNSKTGFSAAWKGESVQTAEPELTVEKQVEQIQYLNGTLALPSEKLADLGIDPIASDDWCVNTDGSEAMKADDYFVGNLQDVLNKIDADINAAKDDAIRVKLEKMRQEAIRRAPPVSVENMRFGMRSPFVENDDLLQFVQGKLAGTSLKARIEKGFVVIDGTAKNDREKVLRRITQYIANGTVTDGGIELVGKDGRLLSKSDTLKQIREEITTWNAQFDTWMKADADFMGEMRRRATDPANIQFPKTDDESPLDIKGAGGIKLHGYQNAFVRKTAREFGGINAFGVGLGKTFTALAAAQYALETGTKKKVCFIVPNAVLSNWNKESNKYYNEAERGNCLFIGADTDKNGDFVVNSKNYARDLNAVLENKHNKIFMTQQAFEKIRMREESTEAYLDYLRKTDKSFAESENAAKDEKAQAKAANLAADLAGKNKLENAPFFEDLGFDSIIVDEAHHYKNAKKTLKNAQVKGLPSGTVSNRAADMACKAWLLRNKNPRKDGVMLLTATPVTNSPLEIYSMFSLAVGEERVAQSLLGSIKGADDFVEAVCEIQNREENNIQGIAQSYSSLVGIKNLDLVRNLIQSNADVKEAADVGIAFKQVESEDVSDGVMLDKETSRELQRYKNAYRIARAIQNGGKITGAAQSEQEREDYFSVVKEVGSEEKVGHPFTIINRMGNALLDLELNSGKTRYKVGNEEAAKRAIEAFNKGKGSFKTDNAPDDESLILKRERKITDNGVQITYTLKTQAVLSDGVVILNCTDFDAQLKLEKLLDAENADVSVNISPKVAALAENVKKEQAHIRATDSDGSRAKWAKQIIFVESLAMHTKIKRILAKECGIPSSRITFISGKFNSDPDEIIEVQELFNADGEANKYSIIIANKKAEVGINLQKGTQAIHHLELNWTPDSITQRNGRGIRQGNTAEKVNVYYYEADGTFDSYKRNAIDRKSNWIGSVMAKPSENAESFAEVGQELTEQDYAEMIDFDFTNGAEAFNELKRRQEERKQAQINQAALQAQAVNIQTIRQANKWLEANENEQDAIKTAVSMAGRDEQEQNAAMDRLYKSIQKGASEKTIEKNRILYERAFERMKQWAEKLEGIVGSTGGSVVVFQPGDGTSYKPYDNYTVAYRRQWNNPEMDYPFADDAPLIADWKKQKAKQLALRESAGRNALQNAQLDGAVPAFAIEAWAVGDTVPEYGGKYYPRGTIVITVNGGIFVLYGNGKDAYFESRFGKITSYRGNYVNEIARNDVKIYRPDATDYIDGLKALAEIEKSTDGVRYNKDDKLPSEVLPDVEDYL